MNNKQHVQNKLKKLSNKQLEQELEASKYFAEKAVFNLMHCISQKVLDIFFNNSQLSPEYYFEDYKSHIEDIEIIKTELKRRNIP